LRFVLGGGRFACNWVLFAAFAAGCGVAAAEDSGVRRNGDGPRLLAPLSGSVSGTRQPVLTFTGAHAARVDICCDRACASPLLSVAGAGGRAQPETPLPAGTVFWRAVAGGQISATWQLVIPSREGAPTAVSATVPDYNGDGVADVAVGQPGAATGVVAVFYGSSAGVSASPVVVVMGGDQFGRTIAAVGDVNGDGFVDLGIASGADPGTVNIYDGGVAGPTLGNALLPGPVTSGFGATMAAAGDVNGDGYGDLLVGGREAAQVFLGSARGMAVTAAFTLPGN
jgi:hypothetical protein